MGAWYVVCGTWGLGTGDWGLRMPNVADAKKGAPSCEEHPTYYTPRTKYLFQASDGTRTHDPRITNAVLYRLSYAGGNKKDARRERPVLHALARIRTATPFGTTPSR